MDRDDDQLINNDIDVLYLVALNKVVIYYKFNLVYEGTPDEIDNAMRMLYTVIHGEMTKLLNTYQVALNKLFEIKNSVNKGEKSDGD